MLIKHRYFWKVPGRLRFTDPKPFLIAHRGFKKSFSENSMGSFLDAQKLGFQWIEIDVISTKDKEVYVLIILISKKKRWEGVI